jgi:hypothetical protein
MVVSFQTRRGQVADGGGDLRNGVGNMCRAMPRTPVRSTRSESLLAK